MRTRSTVLVNDWSAVAGTSSHAGSNTEYHGKISIKTIHDQTTACYAELLKCGKFLPLNPVAVETATYVRSGVPCHVVWDPWNIWLDGHWGSTWMDWSAAPATVPSPPVPLDPDVSNAYLDLVASRAQSNAYDERWDLLTFLAEARKTLAMLAGLIRNFWRAVNLIAQAAVRAFRAGQRRNAAKTLLQYFEELWLLGRYGIRPLVYDIADACRFINTLLEKGNDAFVVGKSRQRDNDAETTPGDWVSSPYPAAARLVETSWEVNRTYRGFAYLGLSGSWADGLSFDPLVTAWELTPWSFVIDWVVGIGDWLSTLTPNIRGEFVATGVSVKTSSTYHRSFMIEPNPDYPEQTGSPGVWTEQWTVERYIREPYLGIPWPQLNLRIDLPKIIDLVALSSRQRSKLMKLLATRR